LAVADMDAVLLNARGQHEAEHLLVARQGDLAIGVNVVDGWRLRQTGEEGGLCKGQVFGAGAEVGLGRRLHAVGQVPIVDLVEVDLENFIPGVAPRDLCGEDDLARLAQG
jgi:hypothetical protein